MKNYWDKYVVKREPDEDWIEYFIDLVGCWYIHNLPEEWIFAQLKHSKCPEILRTKMVDSLNKIKLEGGVEKSFKMWCENNLQTK